MLETGVILLTLFTTGSILGLAYSIDPEAVVIEPISVPAELSKNRGYTSTVISDRVTEEMHRIHEVTATAEKGRGVMLGTEETVVSALEEELDVTGPVWIVRDQLGIKQYKIQGEIVKNGDGLEFRLRGFPRGGGMKVAVERGTLEEIDDLLRMAAEEALRFTDPYVLAAYYFNKEEGTGDFTETLGAIQAGLLPDSEDEHQIMSVKRVYNLWARVLLAGGDHDGAVERIKAALAIDPEYGMAYHTWGMVVFAQEKYREAIKYCQIALKYNPNMPAVYDMWGDSLDALGYLEEAQQSYAIATQLNPHLAHVHFSRGDVYFRLGQYKEALRHYEEGLAIEPGNTKHRYNIEQSRLRLGLDSS